MNVDSDLKAEVLSALFGTTVQFSNQPPATSWLGPIFKFLSVSQPPASVVRGPPQLSNQPPTLSLDDFFFKVMTGSQQPASLFGGSQQSYSPPLTVFLGGSSSSQQRAAYDSVFINEAEFFDPGYDYDFTDLSDLSKCWRGGEEYTRPKGWYRLALKVQGKYPDGDTWLGPGGWRSQSADGEWPVSYHGTNEDGAIGIIEDSYQAGDGDVYGRGIYSTPNLEEASAYARTFKSKTKSKTFKVIMQNRINPKSRKICKRPDYWLIPVPEGTPDSEERAKVESSIRPYGILIKEEKN